MAAPRAVYVGGVGSTLTVDDVAAIAAGAPVQVDTAALDRLKKESPPPKAFAALSSLADVAPETNSGSAPRCLDAQHSRAALLLKLLELLQGKTKARPALASYLGDILNEGLVPLLPAASSDRDALHAIAAACMGLGDIGAQSLEAALVEKQIQPPLLSAGEAAVVLAGRAPGAGMACCLLVDARASLAAGIAIAALAAEALQADVCRCIYHCVLHDGGIAQCTGQCTAHAITKDHKCQCVSSHPRTTHTPRCVCGQTPPMNNKARQFPR